MAQSALVPVQFNGATLVTTLIDGVPYVALRPICESIGVDWQAQHARIKRHPVLNSVVSVTKTTGSDGKQYEMVMLPLNKLNGWLFGVTVSRVKPELRGRLTVYQAECFDVLARHFGAAPALHHCTPGVKPSIGSSTTPQPATTALQLMLITTSHGQSSVQMLPADALPNLLLQGGIFTPRQLSDIAGHAALSMLKEVCNLQVKNEVDHMKKQVRTLHTSDLAEVAKQAWMELSLRGTLQDAKDIRRAV